MPPKAVENDVLQDIRCSVCGRFIGKRGKVNDAEVYIYCPGCKQFAAVLGKKQEKTITTEMMIERLSRDASR